MLQRIQTLWLLLASACTLLTMKFAFYTGIRVQIVAAQVKVSEALTATSNVWIMILTVAIVVAGLINIFNYKNRKLQLRITILLFVLSLVDVLLLFREAQKFESGTYALSAFLAFAAPVFFFLAAKGIYRDQKLVKSLDRLR